MYCLTDPYDSDYRDEHIKEQMREYKDIFLSKIESIVTKAYANDFAKLLVNSWFDDAPEAISISQDLTLDRIHFFAFKENKEGFEEEYLRSRISSYADFD